VGVVATGEGHLEHRHDAAGGVAQDADLRRLAVPSVPQVGTIGVGNGRDLVRTVQRPSRLEDRDGAVDPVSLGVGRVQPSELQPVEVQTGQVQPVQVHLAIKAPVAARRDLLSAQ